MDGKTANSSSTADQDGAALSTTAAPAVNTNPVIPAGGAGVRGQGVSIEISRNFLIKPTCINNMQLSSPTSSSLPSIDRPTAPCINTMHDIPPTITSLPSIDKPSPLCIQGNDSSVNAISQGKKSISAGRQPLHSNDTGQSLSDSQSAEGSYSVNSSNNTGAATINTTASTSGTPNRRINIFSFPVLTPTTGSQTGSLANAQNDLNNAFIASPSLPTNQTLKRRRHSSSSSPNVKRVLLNFDTW